MRPFTSSINRSIRITTSLVVVKLPSSPLSSKSPSSVDLSAYDETDSISSLRARVNNLQSTIQPTVSQVGTVQAQRALGDTGFDGGFKIEGVTLTNFLHKQSIICFY